MHMKSAGGPLDATTTTTTGSRGLASRLTWSAIGVVLVLTAGIALPTAEATNTAGGGGGQVFVPIVPCRLLDTRGAEHVGPRSSPLGSNDTYNQAVTGANGQCNIPASAGAVAMNATTVNGTADSFLTIWPSDAAKPLASNLNWRAGDGPTPNKVDVKLGADGRINIFNNGGTVDVIADVVGYYTDHDHDDRYYTKAQVDAAVAAAVATARDVTHHDTYNSVAAVFVGGAGQGISNCVQATSGAPIVPLVVPVGAQLLSLEVDVLDGSGTNSYRVSLARYTATAIGDNLDVLASATGGTTASSPARVHHVLTPTSPETVEAGESFDIDFGGLSSGNAFCGAILNYRTTG